MDNNFEVEYTVNLSGGGSYKHYHTMPAPAEVNSAEALMQWLVVNGDDVKEFLEAQDGTQSVNVSNAVIKEAP